MKKIFLIGGGLGALQLINNEAVSIIVLTVIAVLLVVKFFGAVMEEADR